MLRIPRLDMGILVCCGSQRVSDPDGTICAADVGTGAISWGTSSAVQRMFMFPGPQWTPHISAFDPSKALQEFDPTVVDVLAKHHSDQYSHANVMKHQCK